MAAVDPQTFRFGEFELDMDAGELRRNGHRLKLQPQPLKLLSLFVRHSGRLVTRDEIRAELWGEGTFVDFDQAVNFSVKQIRDVLHDAAEHPLYVETVPRRGYRFIAPVDKGEASPPPSSPGMTTMRLQKAVWTNIAELRLAEARRRRYTWAVMALAALALAGLTLYTVWSR